MVPLDREFEERKMRVEAQLALIKDGVQARHQTIITIAISSLSLIGVSAFLEKSRGISLAMVCILILNLCVLWYDILVGRKAIMGPQTLLNKLLGDEYAQQAEEITSRSPWYVVNFTEIVGVMFSLIVLYFISVLFSEDTIPKRPEPYLGAHAQYERPMDCRRVISWPRNR